MKMNHGKLTQVWVDKLVIKGGDFYLQPRRKTWGAAGILHMGQQAQIWDFARGGFKIGKKEEEICY